MSATAGSPCGILLWQEHPVSDTSLAVASPHKLMQRHARIWCFTGWLRDSCRPCNANFACMYISPMCSGQASYKLAQFHGLSIREFRGLIFCCVSCLWLSCRAAGSLPSPTSCFLRTDFPQFVVSCLLGVEQTCLCFCCPAGLLVLCRHPHHVFRGRYMGSQPPGGHEPHHVHPCAVHMDLDRWVNHGLAH
jgi:hypothetical protein